MDKSSVVINRPGVYLFHAPTTIALQLNRELLTVFSVPDRGMVGLLLLTGQEHTSDILQLLNTLHNKLQNELFVTDNQVRVKLLGMSTVNSATRNVVLNWLTHAKLDVVAEDTGRNVARKIFIDCESGLAGVGYAEGYAQTSWVDDSSAKQRVHIDGPHFNLLALSNSSTSRNLCKQAVEELAIWNTTIPETPLDLVMSTTADFSQFQVVMVFDDFAKNNEKPLKKFLKNLLEKNPQVRAFFVGKRRPSFLANFSTLPPLAPTAVKRFKRALHEELRASTGAALGDVLQFKSVKKKAG